MINEENIKLKKDIEFYNDKIDEISTHIEIMNNSKFDVENYIKVSAISSSIGLSGILIAINQLQGLDPNKAMYYIIAGLGLEVLGIYALKNDLESRNKNYDMKISDDLREINNIENKITLIKKKIQYNEENESKYNDDSISSMMVINRGKILERKKTEK